MSIQWLVLLSKIQETWIRKSDRLMERLSSVGGQVGQGVNGLKAKTSSWVRWTALPRACTVSEARRYPLELAL
jgi:hypothetical protein